MKSKLKQGASLLLTLCLLLAFTPAFRAEAANPGSFPDVPGEAWYGDALQKIRTYTPGIINGIQDSDGVLRFHPEMTVLRGQFLKMSMIAAEAYTTDHSRDNIHWAGVYYTIALENGILIPDAYVGNTPMFPCTREALDAPITRYEMAVILTNACLNLQMESKVVVSGASSHITDYSSISAYANNGFTGAVEQAYGKGLLTGYGDGSFRGDRLLTRAEAVMVIYRQLNWKDSRTTPNWVTETGNVTTPVQPATGESFAQWLQNGHIDAWGNLDAEARLRLFGDPNKSCFYSAAEAEPYMQNVTIPIWTIDLKTGEKYATTTVLTVNKAVANEVLLIFTQIFNDPEQYPIYAYSVGCARFSDTMRHSWGCAIDINPYFNCECNFHWGGQTVTCGYGWWPKGMEGQTWVGRDSSAYHGTMTEPSPYSIAPGSSVVRAFAAYGWGWGGSGTNDPNATPRGWSSGNNFDFMHFSVLPSGG